MLLILTKRKGGVDGLVMITFRNNHLRKVSIAESDFKLVAVKEIPLGISLNPSPVNSPR